jgi:hypothetical protein
MPDMPGSMMSSTISPKAPERACWSASAPSWTTVTS